MQSQIVFSRTKVGHQSSEEEGCLGIVCNSIVAVLICLKKENDPDSSSEWYLESGFGPCDRQGLLFPSLEAAGIWILDQLNSAGK